MKRELSIKDLCQSNNIFTGTVTRVIKGPTNEIVTIRLDPGESIELTFSYVPLPQPTGFCDDEVRTDAVHDQTSGDSASGGSGGSGSGGSGSGSSGGTTPGQTVTVVVPVPTAVVVPNAVVVKGI